MATSSGGPSIDSGPRPILVVSHEASRTGAPRVAITLMKAFQQAGLPVHLVARWRGPLVPEFAAAAPGSFSFEPLMRLRVVLRRFRRTRTLATRLEVAMARRVIRRIRPALVWANTVKSACYVRPAVEEGIPVVLHVHELEPLASQTLRRYGLETLPEGVQLVGCSTRVGEHLAELAEGSGEEIEVLHSPVDVANVETLAAVADHEAMYHSSVVACGTPDARKGVDLWLEVVRRVGAAAQAGETTFTWVGGDAPRGGVLPPGTRFTGELENPYPVIAAAEVFTLTSREDPFPLVVLEAMTLGRPIVAFDVGGVREQVGDAGILVPPGDLPAMASAVAALLGDEAARRALGRAARERVIERFSASVFGPRAVAVATTMLQRVS